jgi:hypothetical protein
MSDRNRTTSPLLEPLRQPIESVDATRRTQLDLERHWGRTPNGVMTRGLQRLLALTAAFWHNAHSGQRPCDRSSRSITADPLELIS